MPVRSIHQWFAEYGESHQNATNTLIHWICVPAIYFSVVGLVVSIPSPAVPVLAAHHVWAYLALLAVLFFYVQRSIPIAVGMVVWNVLCVVLAIWLQHHAPWPLWAICIVVFALAWVGQFYGHHVEGKKPSFLKDLQILLIGPAWLLAKVYRRFGIPF